MFAITNFGDFIYHDGKCVVISGFFLERILKHSRYNDPTKNVINSCMKDYVLFEGDE